MMLANIKQIELLTKQRRYDEALNECNKALQEASHSQLDILRARANIFSRLGWYDQAMKDRQSIIDSGSGTMQDYFRAADHALHIKQFDQAICWFRKVLHMGEQHNESWFKSAAHFYLAYAHMEIHQFRQALIDLDCAVSVESDVGVTLPDMCGIVSHSQLREEIMRRAEIGAAKQ